MTNTLSIPLVLQSGEFSRLSELQAMFSEACNQIAYTVQEARCWNRVALHHLAYRQLRQSYPDLGAQMACNVIYSVCRAARAVYQSSESPWNVKAHPDQSLPLIRFQACAPVYFDRHTLSLKNGRLSLFTLDGRMKIKIDLGPRDEQLLMAGKLCEISLVRNNNSFELQFTTDKRDVTPSAFIAEGGGDFFEHLIIEDPSVLMMAEHQTASVEASKSREAI